MISELLHASQWCYRHHFNFGASIFNKLMMFVCGADIPGQTKIHPTVSFAHGGLGVVINPASVIGPDCIINAKVTLGNAYPHGGAPTLGKGVYVGAGAFIGGYLCR